MDVAVCVEALDALVPQILEVSQTPGVSVALGVGADVVWAKGYGLADLASGRPMAADTVAPIGSDSKTYTAAAAMQLVERGLIRLDDPVNDHLRGLRVVNPHGDRPITLRDLLTHRSGLGTTFGFADRVPPPPLAEHLRGVFRTGRTDVYGGSLLPLWATPVGAQYQYANTGLALVGYLVELANPDRVPFSEWVRRRVFDPLGMRSSCFPPVHNAEHVPAELLARRSVGYATLGGFQFPLPPIHIGDYPAGSALSTPSDHARFVLAMLAGGTLGHGTSWTRRPPGRCLPRRRRSARTRSPRSDWSGMCSHPSTRPATSDTAGSTSGDGATSPAVGQPGGWPWWCRRTSGTWGLSYLAGLQVADRLTTRISATTPLIVEDIAAVAAAAVPAPGTLWDPEAFQAAMRDLAAAGGTLADVLELGRQQIPSHDLGLLQRQLGVPRLRDQSAPFSKW